MVIVDSGTKNLNSGEIGTSNAIDFTLAHNMEGRWVGGRRRWLLSPLLTKLAFPAFCNEDSRAMDLKLGCATMVKQPQLAKRASGHGSWLCGTRRSSHGWSTNQCSILYILKVVSLS